MMMCSIHQEKHGWGCNQNYMKHPESVLGDGESHVITHLLTARLEGVAGKLQLFILKQVGGHSSQDQYPKHEHEEKPEASEHRRVGLEVVKEATEEAPFTHGCSAVRNLCGNLEIYSPDPHE